MEPTEPRPPRARRWMRRGWLVGLIVALGIWGLTDIRNRGYPHPESRLKHRTDLTVYTEAGAAFFDGRPPYEVTNPRGWRYLYPPLFAMLLAPLHWLPSQDQVVVWFFLNVLLCWGCLRECRRLVRGLCAADDSLAAVAGRRFPWLGISVLLAAVLPTLNCLQRGQVGILKLYLLLLGLRLILRASEKTGTGSVGSQENADDLRPGTVPVSVLSQVGGGIVLALPIVLKLIPILPVAILLLAQLAAALRRPAPGRAPASTARRQLVASGLGVALGMALFFLLIPAALIGWHANLDHLRTWSRLIPSQDVDEDHQRLAGLEEHTVRNQSLSNAVYRMGNFVAHLAAHGPDDRLAQSLQPPRLPMDDPRVAQALFWLRLTILAALLAAAVRLGIGGDPLGQAVGLALGCVAMLVLSPIARGHYFMLLVPAALLMPLWLDRQGFSRTATAMAWAPALLTVAHYTLLNHAGRIGMLGLGTTGWLIAGMVLVGLSGGREPPAGPATRVAGAGVDAFHSGRVAGPTQRAA